MDISTYNTNSFKKTKLKSTFSFIDIEDFNYLQNIISIICESQEIELILLNENRFLQNTPKGLKETDIPILQKVDTSKRSQTDFFQNIKIINEDKVLETYLPLVDKEDEKGSYYGTILIYDPINTNYTKKQIENLNQISNQFKKSIKERIKTKLIADKNIELKKIKKLFNESQRISNIGAWELDLKTNEVIWTKHVYDIHEVPSNFDPNKNEALNFYHPEDRNKIENALKNTIKTGEEFDVTCRLITSNNSIKWVRSIGIKYKNKNKVTKLIGTFQDISETKKNEIESKYNEDILKSLFKLSPIGIALNDFETGEFLDCNDKIIEPTGYTKDEFLELNYWKSFNNKKELKIFAELKNKEYYGPFEKEYTRKDGSTYSVMLQGFVVKDLNGRKRIWSFVEDITYSKELENKTLEANHKLQAVLDACSEVSIVSTDNKGVITLFNKGAEKLFGYKSEEVVGKHSPTLFNTQEENESIRSKLLKFKNEKLINLEKVSNNTEEHNSFNKEWIYIDKNGKKFPAFTSITAIKQQGITTGFLGVSVDISEIKKAHSDIKSLLKITQDQNNRLKNFSYIVSHNLRSYVSGICGLLELLKDEKDITFENELVQLLVSGSDNLKNTIEDLSQIININFNEDKYIPSNLHQVIENNLETLQPILLNSKIEITNDINKELTINVIPAFIESIVLNLITNAIKYRDIEKNSFLKINATVNKNLITIDFKDNGMGIDLHKDGEKLFGMYKTFHQHEDSRGLGLFIIRNQIESMGGHIEVESQLNIGTTFKINLPYEKN